MSSHQRRSRVSRLAGLTLLSLSAASVGLAGSAGATVTGTTITGTNYPAAFTMSVESENAGYSKSPGLELTGTNNGSSGTSSLDSVCYEDSTSTNRLGTNAAVSGGTFRIVSYVPQGRTCDLRVVPTPTMGGTYPSGAALAAYPAHRASFGLVEASNGRSDSLNGGTQIASFMELPQATSDITSYEPVENDSGIYGALVDSSLDQSEVLQEAAGLPNDGTMLPGAQGGVRVDGVNAVSLYVIDDAFSSGNDEPAFPGGETVAATTDPTTGDTVETTSQPLVTCADPSLPLTAAKCTTIHDTGVALTRTISTSQGGRLIRVTDGWSSPGFHTLSLDYQHSVYNSGSGAEAGPVFSTNAGASYAPLTDGAPIAAPTAPFTVLAKTATDDPSFTHPAVSITYSTTPTSMTADGTGHTLVTHYDRSIPAGGAFTLTHTYALSDSAAQLSALSALARSQGLTPTISLAAQPASTSNRDITLTGTVTPGQNGLPGSVTGPGGHTAAVNPTTGAFALPVTLSPGAQNLVVMSVDAAGNVSSAVTTGNYVDPLTFGKLGKRLVTKKVTTTTRRTVKGKVTVKKVTVKVTKGVQITVPVTCAATASAPCTASLAVVIGHTTGHAGVGLAPGKSTTVVLTLSAGEFRAYLVAHTPPKPTKHNRHPKAKTLTATVTGSFLDADGTAFPTVSQQAIKL